MRSGNLIHKVTFQENIGMKSATGAVGKIWADLSLNPYEMVQIIPLKMEERYVSKGLKTEVSHKIRLRYRSDLNSQMKIVYGLRVFNIDSIINPFERNRELHIMATEVF